MTATRIAVDRGMKYCSDIVAGTGVGAGVAEGASSTANADCA